MAFSPTPEFLRIGGRPASPANTSWFEFLLKPELLVKHLKNEYAIPGPNQLLIQFLQQSHCLENNPEFKKPETTAANGEHNQAGNEEIGDRVQEPDEKIYHQKKAKALKLLALKVAAFCNWDLEYLMVDIPGPMVHQLLLELLAATSSNVTGISEVNLDWLCSESCSNQEFFAILLYQRWCVRIVLQDCLPKKPIKINSIPVPGLTEPVIPVTNVSEEKLTQIKKVFGKCKTLLEHCLTRRRTACLPTHDCFDFTGTALGEVKLNWGSGRQLMFEEWAQQIAYELGCMFFYEADYVRALGLFKSCDNWSKQAQSVLKDTERKQLTGYLNACEALVSKTIQTDINSRFDRALQSKDLKNLATILLEDCSAMKLPASACVEVVRIATSERPSAERSELVGVCAVSYAMRGEPFTGSSDIRDICMNRQHCLVLMQTITAVLPRATPVQKANLKGLVLFMLSLCNERVASAIKEFPQLDQLIAASASRTLVASHDAMDTKAVQSLLAASLSDADEHHLAISYDPSTIWDRLCRIHKSGGVAALKLVVDFWKLSKELDRLFTELPMDIDTVCTYVLLAKSKELMSIQHFEMIAPLLTAADRTIKEKSGKISKIIRWELLYASLVGKQSSSEQVISEDPADLVKKVKSCLTSLQVESDIYPHDTLVMVCVSYLLLSKEWDYLSSLHGTRVGFTEYARQLINVCKELPDVRLAKLPGMVLWETTLLICSSQDSSKRMRLGNQAVLTKDGFRKFLLTIQEPCVLSVLISLLTRMYSIKNSDIDIDRSYEYSTVWPETIPAHNNLDESYLKDIMIRLVQHALGTNSMQSNWLKTYAEIQYALGNQSEALKFYLQAASASTSFFAEPVPKYIFDNEVFKKLIKCCVNLKRFTQAALLTLFTEECDYAVVFKYLQERVCMDGMDMYYDFLWDITVIEFLINLHGKRGELEKKSTLLQMIGTPELNGSNPIEIQLHVKKLKQAKFFRALALQYL